MIACVSAFALAERVNLTERQFRRRFTVMLGSRDGDGETRGTLLRTQNIDRFGTLRLARGRAFFDAAQRNAKDLGMTLNWSLQTGPDMGGMTFGP